MLKANKETSQEFNGRGEYSAEHCKGTKTLGGGK